MSNILTDKNGRKLGEIKSQGKDRFVGLDALGRKVGEYNSHTNETCDNIGRRVGMGNLLAGLIYKPK